MALPEAPPRAPRLLEAMLFLLCVFAYGFSYEWAIGSNGIAHVNQSAALAEHGTFAIDDVLFHEFGATCDWSVVTTTVQPG